MNNRTEKPESATEIESKISIFEKAFDKGLKSIEKKIESIQRSLQDTSRIAEVQLRGDLLKAHFNEIPRGKSFVELPNVYNEKQEIIRIELDPKKNVNENMSFYFKKAQKLAGSLDVEKERLEIVLGELGQVKLAKEKFLASLDFEYAAKVLETYHLIKFLATNSQKAPPKKISPQEAMRNRLKLFYSSTGHKIYVGGSAEENEFVTFQIGKGKDFWLHVEGFPGSHVVIKLKNKSDKIEMNAIREAALLALHYSKRRGSTNSLVVYTNACHVKKIKGAPKGTVLPHFTKTIKVNDSAEEIKKISEYTRKYLLEGIQD